MRSCTPCGGDGQSVPQDCRAGPKGSCCARTSQGRRTAGMHDANAVLLDPPASLLLVSHIAASATSGQGAAQDDAAKKDYTMGCGLFLQPLLCFTAPHLTACQTSTEWVMNTILCLALRVIATFWSAGQGAAQIDAAKNDNNMGCGLLLQPLPCPSCRALRPLPAPNFRWRRVLHVCTLLHAWLRCLHPNTHHCGARLQWQQQPECGVMGGVGA